MDFFGTPIEQFVSTIAIVVGFCLVLLWREITHAHVTAKMQAEINSLHAQMNALQAVLVRHYPSEVVNLHVDGDVHDSTLSTAGHNVKAK